MFFFLLTCVVINAQEKKLNSEDLTNSRIDLYKYDLWWGGNSGDYRWFPKADSTPYFIDNNKYKGMLNYGIKFSSKDGRGYTFVENLNTHFLDLTFTYFDYNEKDSIAKIKGIISGGWNNKNIRNKIHIFLGKPEYTKSKLYFKENRKKESRIISYLNKEVNDPILLDSFPSFYFNDYDHFSIPRIKDVQEFELSLKVKKNSVLVFGNEYSYGEVYDVGKLIYGNNFANSIPKSELDKEIGQKYRVIIKDNIPVLSGISTLGTEEKEGQYYINTAKAENAILNGQYKIAIERYKFLTNKYGNLFARDLHNAIKSATFIRDYKSAISWSKKLVLKGVPLKYFQSETFSVLKRNKYWKDFISQYEMLNKQYKNNLNKGLRRELNKLISADQNIYIKNRADEIEKYQLKQITDSIDEKLIKLIQREGFPSEERVGINLTDDSLTIKSAPFFSILIYHSYQIRGEYFEEVKSIIDKGAKNFEFDAYRSNLRLIQLSGDSCLQIYKGNLYNKKNCVLDQIQVDKISFLFDSKHNFILDAGNYGVVPFEKDNEGFYDRYFFEDFNFIKKLTDDWKFYEKK